MTRRRSRSQHEHIKPPNVLHIIKFSSAFVTTMIGCQSSGGLDEKAIEERLVILDAVGSLLGLTDIRVRIKSMLNASDGTELFHSVFSLIDTIEKEEMEPLDKNNQMLGFWFFVSSVIELEDIWLSYQLGKDVAQRDVTLDAPFLRRAKYLSEQLNVIPPDLTLTDRSDAELIFAREMIRTWRTSLCEKAEAMRKPIDRSQSKLLSLIAHWTFIVGIVITIAGIVLVTVGNSQADSSMKLFGQEITTDSAGVASIFIGAMMVVSNVRRILKSFDKK